MAPAVEKVASMVEPARQSNGQSPRDAVETHGRQSRCCPSARPSEEYISAPRRLQQETSCYHAPMTDPSNGFHSARLHQVGEGEDGQRIDNFLVRLLKGVPRSRIYRMVRKGEVRVNGGRVDASYRLCPGDKLRLPPVRTAERPAAPAPGSRVLDQLARSIIYEDDRVIVLNKPAGVAVHGGSGIDYGVIEALRLLRPKDTGLELVHRLDRETSGCLVLAKRRSALRILHALFRDGKVDKRYWALLSGSLDGERRDVRLALRKNTLRSGERIVCPDATGKPALTRFCVRRRFPTATLVEAKPQTGRTHQIRVHAAAIGAPILGDEKYGDPDANRAARRNGLRRLFLHAASLAFRWPEEDRGRSFEAELDPELQQYLVTLGRAS